MAYTPDINEVALVMSRLQHNYSQLANNWFTVFFDPTPRQSVTVTWYDEDGNLDTYTLPNRAYDFTYILHGSGSPEGVVSASVGSTYQDTTNGDAYIKKVGATDKVGWTRFASLAELSAYILKGAYDPEGQVSAPIATLFANTTNGQLWIKQSGTGNTGWASVSFNQAYVDQQIATRAKTDLSNLTATGETHFLNKTEISNCILSAPANFCTSSATTITVKANTTFLFPNGRNTNHTLNNIEYKLTQDRVFTNTDVTVQSDLIGFFNYNNSIESFSYWNKADVYYQDEEPVTPASGIYAMWFSPSTNTWQYTNNGASWITTIAVPFCNFAIADTSGNIGSLIAKDIVSIAKISDIKDMVDGVNVVNLSGTAVTLQDGNAHNITITGATTFTLPTVQNDTKFHQILVLVNMPTVYSLTLGTTHYFNNSAPSMSCAGSYTLIYEYSGTNWYVGALYKGA